MKTDFNWGDDIIDSRDIITRHEELQDEYNSLVEALEEAKGDLDDFLRENDTDPDSKDEDDDSVAFIRRRLNELHEVVEEAQEALDQFNQSFDKDELDLLTEVISQGEDSPDWSYGEGLIHESYFTEYAEQLANDVCEFPKEFQSGQWPFNHMKIDWESAAQELQSDYFDISAGGETYWIRV
jgi:hypothetical protein